MRIQVGTEGGVTLKPDNLAGSAFFARTRRSPDIRHLEGSTARSAASLIRWEEPCDGDVTEDADLLKHATNGSKRDALKRSQGHQVIRRGAERRSADARRSTAQRGTVETRVSNQLHQW